MSLEWQRVWPQLGSCLGKDPAIWFADDSDVSAVAKAKRICAACPVRVDCLVAAVEMKEKFGIWAGANEKTIRVLTAARARSDRDRPLPYDQSDPWSHAVALHFDALDRDCADAIGPDTISPQISFGFHPSRPTLLDLPNTTSTNQCERCGSATRDTGVVDRNGAGAICGKASTYSAGCRCIPCGEAHMARKSQAAEDASAARIDRRQISFEFANA